MNTGNYKHTEEYENGKAPDDDKMPTEVTQENQN